jgi:hypothetical protein
VDIKNNPKIEDISKYLIQKLSAKEVVGDEFLARNKDIYEGEIKDIAAIYKIEDENIIQSLLSEDEKSEIEIIIKHLNENNHIEEDCSLYMNEISTGKLIVIILESKDKINLSGFVMEGNGQKLFDYLMSLIDEPIEKVSNQLDQLIEESRNFKPYGKYFN